MRSHTRRIAATSSFVLLATVVVGGAHAEPNYTKKTLLSTAVHGHCTAHSATQTTSGFRADPAGSVVSCGIDSVRFPSTDVDSATAYVRGHPASTGGWARICYTQMKGTIVCGPKTYFTPTGALQEVTALAPAGSFDLTYLAYFQVLLPATRSYASNMYGFYLSKHVPNQ